MTPQGASTFNEPLSLDTSSVTDMSHMFEVANPPPGRMSSRFLRTRCVHRHRPPRFALVTCLCLRTPQDTGRFNQPLSFDTSSVTDMSYMFKVRSHPRMCRATGAQSGFPHTCRVHRARPRVRSPHAPLFDDSAGCPVVQFTAEPRHVQRHGHEPHVLRALPPGMCRAPGAQSVPHTRCVHRKRPPRLPSLCASV